MAKINTIKEYDVANGPGVRMSVWFQGCPHKCTGCFNEETWDKDGKGDVYNETHLQKIISILSSSPVHKDLSILGGEPLVNYNIDAVIDICKNIKKVFPNVQIWIWSGFLFETLIKLEKFQELVNYFDVLVDGKFEIDKKDLTLMYRGSSNQRVIDIKETLQNNNQIKFLDIK